MSKTENAATVSLDPPLAYPDYRSTILARRVCFPSCWNPAGPNEADRCSVTAPSIRSSTTSLARPNARRSVNASWWKEHVVDQRRAAGGRHAR